MQTHSLQTGYSWSSKPFAFFSRRALKKKHNYRYISRQAERQEGRETGIQRDRNLGRRIIMQTDREYLQRVSQPGGQVDGVRTQSKLENQSLHIKQIYITPIGNHPKE